MGRKKITDELEEIEEIDVLEPKVENIVIEPKSKPDVKKKAYKVVLVTKNKIIYESSPGNGASTKNIWDDKLVPGDTIYLEE